MTFKKGTLWKTSWNRGRGGPPSSVAGQMAFFTGFASEDNADNSAYFTAGLPTLGSSSPYWFAVVGTGAATGSSFFGSLPRYSAEVSSFTTGVCKAEGQILSAAGDYLASLLNQGDGSVSAVLVTVQGTTDVQVQVCFADQVFQYIADAGTFAAPNVQLSMYPFSGGGLHGACGGNVLPTDAEISQWFADLKSNLAIGGVPGKTTHLYSAASVFPAVPATLLNSQNPGTDNLDYTVLSGAPTPANVLLNVRFPW